MLFGKHINKYYLKYCPALILGLIALVAVDYFQLEIPELYRMLINGINSEEVEYSGTVLPFNMDFLLDKICLPLIFIILAMIVCRFLWRVCFFGSAIKMESDMRSEMFGHAEFLSTQYYQVNKVGGLMSYFINDLDTVRECFGWGVMMLFDALLLGGLAITKMYRLNPSLTNFSLIPMVLLLAVGGVLGKYEMDKWEERQAKFSELSDFSQESFSGIAVIKAFVKETKELLEFKKLNKKNEKVNIEFTRLSTILNILVTLFVQSLMCVILGYGGYLVYTDVLNAGEIIEFLGYFTAVIWPVMAISQLIDMTARGRASLKRVSELLEAKIDVADEEGAKDLDSIGGKIEFKDLSFRYPDGEYDVLKNISFTIQKGERVGIVGKTGAGKTTLVDLMVRLYNVPRGTIFIDDTDINDITLHSLRNGFAYVPQDNFLFSDTIENNIAFSSDGTIEEIENAARLADVHDNIVDFTEGYKTVLGERGVTVSGGQKQRISIARAIMKNAPILILDDSVSAVDTKTEKIILENLHNYRKNATTILIAHRISTVEDMDKIILMDDGEIIAVGSHEELCSSCPEYKKMVDIQRLEDESKEV